MEMGFQAHVPIDLLLGKKPEVHVEYEFGWVPERGFGALEKVPFIFIRTKIYHWLY
jgi:hypothetical protein